MRITHSYKQHPIWEMEPTKGRLEGVLINNLRQKGTILLQLLCFFLLHDPSHTNQHKQNNNYLTKDANLWEWVWRTTELLEKHYSLDALNKRISKPCSDEAIYLFISTFDTERATNRHCTEATNQNSQAWATVCHLHVWVHIQSETHRRWFSWQDILWGFWIFIVSNITQCFNFRCIKEHLLYLCVAVCMRCILNVSAAGTNVSDHFIFLQGLVSLFCVWVRKGVSVPVHVFLSVVGVLGGGLM